MTELAPSPFQLHTNASVDRTSAFAEVRDMPLHSDGMAEARAAITAWPNYAPTPLLALRDLAARANLGQVYYKDEAGRFGLGSFKALGGAYGVFRLLRREIENRGGPAAVSPQDLASGLFRRITADITVTCATDGNHGRSVAWAARVFGCKCVVYVHESVSEPRCAAIASYGAEVRRNAGNYDDAVAMAAAMAAKNGWFVVSDTAYDGYVEIPVDIMHGYTIIVAEVLAQLDALAPLTHVFVQAGVGGLAAAVCAAFWQRFGTRRPRLIVVEPNNAACLYASVRRGAATTLDSPLDTFMAGLACGAPSQVAWQILNTGADDFMTIQDEAAAQCMSLLAKTVGTDGAIVAGESAVAGLAGALLAAQDPAARHRLALDEMSRVLVIGTEGATDPAIYEQIVGRSAEAVRSAPDKRPAAAIP